VRYKIEEKADYRRQEEKKVRSSRKAEKVQKHQSQAKSRD